MKKLEIQWTPTYNTIAIYPRGMDYIAHELQSNIYVRDMVALTALKRLVARLTEIQLSVETAEKKGFKVVRPDPKPPSDEFIASIKKSRGVILRGVTLDP